MTVSTVQVSLADRSYPVIIGPGLLGQAGKRISALRPKARLAVVTDERIATLHLTTLQASLSAAGFEHTAIILPEGEGQKSFRGLELLCNALLKLELDRGDLVVAFGGGVIGDLAGFAAGILKRGLDFVQIPTTLLAQVDSSVGGKTAINAPAGKNLVGLFWQPRLVLADLDVLATLPPRQLRAGWAEIIKYGLIRDAAFFEWCEANVERVLGGDIDALRTAVEASVAAKARIVAADERESGERALLNFGHTFAHAFESCAGLGEAGLLHGEAVACGMALAFRFSERLGLLGRAEAYRVEALIEASGMASYPRALPGGPWKAEALLAAMAHDKKNEGGRLTLILARGIGNAFIMKDAPIEHVADFLGDEVRK